MPTARNESSRTTAEERHSQPPQNQTEALMDGFACPRAEMEERPSFAVSENAIKTPTKATQQVSSKTHEDGRKAITKAQDEPHMDKHDETQKLNDPPEKNNNATSTCSVAAAEQSDVSDCCVSDLGGTDAPCILVSGLGDLYTEPEMKFDIDRDYSYNWVDDMWTAYGARHMTRDESEYEAEMERVQAQYEMEFELNQSNTYSFTNGHPKDGTQNAKDSEPHSDEEGNGTDCTQSEVTGQSDFEADSREDSYSEVNGVEDAQSDETGTDEASSGNGTDGTPSEVTATEDDFETDSGSDDSYSDDNTSPDEDESEETSSGMDDDEVADYEKDEYERARRKEMDIIHWIETVNMAMFPHLVNNYLEIHPVVTESQAFVTPASHTGLGDMQSAASEDEDHEAQSCDDSYISGSESALTENEGDYQESSEGTARSETTAAYDQNAVTQDHEAGNDNSYGKSDYEEESEETTNETADVQRDTHGGEMRYDGTRKTGDERKCEKAMCCPLPMMHGQKQTQKMNVAYVNAGASELSPNLKTVTVESNNATGIRGRLGRGLARFSAAARRLFQSCLPRCCRGSNR